MTTVRQHERQKPRKPDEYINTHLALFSRRADRIAFCQRHGIEIANDEVPQRESIIERFMPWFRRRK